MGNFDDALGGGRGDASPRASSTAATTPADSTKNGLPLPSNGGGGGGDLLDLEAIFGGGSAPAPPVQAAGNGAGQGTGGGGGGGDLLADVFGASAGIAPTKAAAGSATPTVVPASAAAAVPAAVPEEDFGGFEVAPSREEKVVVGHVDECEVGSRGVICFTLSCGTGVTPALRESLVAYHWTKGYPCYARVLGLCF